MQDPKTNSKNCLQDEPAFCTVACPFGLDVRDFAEKMERGSFQSAFKAYRNAVGFPAVVSSLCPAPCKAACPRKNTDAPVALDRLERAAVALAPKKVPTDYNVPAKKERVAVVGAGPGGLACALRLCQKKYSVTMFEKEDEIGGSLRNLPGREAYLEDVRCQFQFEQYELVLGRTITALAQLEGFDAVYLATGDSFGLVSENGFSTEAPGVFAGALPPNAPLVEAIAHGLEAFHHIEHYLKTGNAGRQLRPACTAMVLDASVLFPAQPAAPGPGGQDTPESARAEAARCLRCRCDACLRHCELMQGAKKFPKRLMDEAFSSINPSALDGHSTIGNRDISTCNLCGLCGDLCPESIDVGAYYLECRRTMQQNGTMPWVFHDFWLRDMEFTNSKAACVAKTPPGYAASQYMFFPGCQLGAAQPDAVAGLYRLLLECYPDTALRTGCCGAPAVWAGREDLQQEVFEGIRKDWLSFGCPVAVFACPSCQKMFARYLPQMQTAFWWDVVKADKLPAAGGAGKTLSVFDPCASRGNAAMQDKARKIVQDMGYTLRPLAHERDSAQCCGWGGHVAVAAPEYAKTVAQHRIAQSDTPYLAYCINCRDVFTQAGKECYHILDLVLGLRPSNAPPTVTRRRHNRQSLKAQLLKELWEQEWRMKDEAGGMALFIPQPLREKLSAALILEEDVRAVVARCEETGQKLLRKNSDVLTGHGLVGYMTYWVEYRPCDGGGFELMNAYAHRMEIEEDKMQERKSSAPAARKGRDT